MCIAHEASADKAEIEVFHNSSPPAGHIEIVLMIALPLIRKGSNHQTISEWNKFFNNKNK